MKLKVARIVPDFLPSEKAYGFYVSFLKLSLYQRELGHEVVIIARGNRNGEEEVEGFRVVRVASKPPPSYLSFQLQAAKVIRREAPDIVHSHGRIALGISYLNHDISHIVHLHGLPYLAMKKYRRILEPSLPQLAYDLRIHTLYKLALRKSRAVVSYSHDLASELPMYGIPEEGVWIVYNGVDERFLEHYPDMHDGIRARLPSSEELLLFVGRPILIKGIFHLLRAMPLILKQHPSAKLVVAGEPHKGGLFQRYIATLKLSDHVISLGHVEHDQLPSLYSACAVHVANTLVAGYPKTVMESLASTTPVVASRNMDNRMIVEKNGCGLLVDPTNPTEIAHAVVELLSNRSRAREMGERGRGIVADRFTWRRSAENLDRLYRKVIAS